MLGWGSQQAPRTADSPGRHGGFRCPGNGPLSGPAVTALQVVRIAGCTETEAKASSDKPDVPASLVPASCAPSLCAVGSSTSCG